GYRPVGGTGPESRRRGSWRCVLPDRFGELGGADPHQVLDATDGGFLGAARGHADPGLPDRLARSVDRSEGQPAGTGPGAVPGVAARPGASACRGSVGGSFAGRAERLRPCRGGVVPVLLRPGLSGPALVEDDGPPPAAAVQLRSDPGHGFL